MSMAVELDRYHLALGRFATQFAEVEAFVRIQCGIAASTPVELLGVLYGELGSRAGITLLKKLRQAKGVPEDPELTRAMIQLGLIAELRNAILHKGTTFAEDHFHSSAGLPGSRRQEHFVSAEILTDMIMDLQTIKAALGLANPPADAGSLDWSEGLRNAARSPWRYRPQRQ